MKKESQNYLEKIPVRREDLSFEINDDGIVTLIVSNRGFFNRLFQILLKKPKESFVHLDEMGSFLWPLFDGEKNLVRLGEEVKAHFGEKAEPLYPRLAKYIQTLFSYGFIRFQ